MSLSSTLKKLASSSEYPSRGRIVKRWGQLLREPSDVAKVFHDLEAQGTLVALADVARIAGGAVPRANAYFLVRELPAASIPHRFNLTARDLERVAVIEDGLQTLHRIERTCLSAVVKGPDSLLSPTTIAETELRLFNVGKRSKEDLRDERANGALAYVKRGETVPYSVSEDSLKGGVPALRAQVKDRRPYWYSISTSPTDRPRIVVPEHFDRRFAAALLTAEQDDIVMDKLFAVTPENDRDADLLLASLHSLIALYQLEFRGRTNLGEGVLEMKRADWAGVLVPTPSRLSAAARDLIAEAFEPLKNRPVGPIMEELADPDRVLFDNAMLDALGIEDPESLRITIEREFRAAVSERRERAASVHDAKASRAAVKRVPTNIDAYAARIASVLEPYPDPRVFFNSGPEELILISGAVEGELTIGEDLLNQGDVFAANTLVASTGDLLRAQFVRGVLVHDPDLKAVPVPAADADLETALAGWRDAASTWRVAFDAQVKKTASALGDDRVAKEVRERALALLHAT